MSIPPATSTGRSIFGSATDKWNSLTRTGTGTGSPAVSNAANQAAAELNDPFRTPYHHDIGDEYDATFAQAPISNRVILTTPNLIVGTSPNHANSLVFTTVHEHASSIGGEESPSSQEQLTASARLCDTFGPAKRCGIEFKRPFHIDTSLYGCLPMQLAQSRPTAKFATEVTDLKSGVSVGASSRLSGSEWIHTLQSRGRYAAFTAALQNSAKLSDYRTLTGSVSTTLWRDSLLDRSLTAGVDLQSASFDSTQVSYPTKLNGITLKAAYDERQFTVDTTIKAAQYAHAGTEQPKFKVSDVHIRGVYAHNLGKYPRWCAGASVGLVDGVNSTDSQRAFEPYNEPNASLVGPLTNPVASTSFYYQLNPNNKMKVSLDSGRRLRSTYNYALTSNVQFIATFQALFPAGNLSSMQTAATAIKGVKPTIGLAIQIGAE